jgi:hypothetical protein
MFQDRAWYSVDARGEKPNSLWHSEIDEPESSPAAYELVLQENQADPDALVAIVPFGSSLLAIQSRHIYRIQYVSQPLLDASVTLAGYRGVLTPRCLDVYEGVMFAADSYGLYAFDGSRVDPISTPVDDYWRDGRIDFSKTSTYHVAVNPNERVVRFHYCQPGDGANPTRALCFCIATRAWWEETYPQPITSTVQVPIGGKRQAIVGGSGGFLKPAKNTAEAGGAAIPYSVQFGNYAFDNDNSRDVSVLYRPTDASLRLELRYNGSTAPRSNAVDVSRGDGWSMAAASTAAVLDMRADRSPLGQAPGLATARYFGRADDKSAGADRHLSVGLSGDKASTAADIRLHAIAVRGVQ